uniref:Uncharacterized protein n=1 Tax=Panagrolaimus sp. PS1159 TaxID=55785 RepID=A0AC35FP53_9BILA
MFYAKSKDDDEESSSHPQIYESFKSLRPFNENSNNKTFNDKLDNGSNTDLIIPQQRYIGCNFYETNGIGYQLWRFASLYGIGRDLNRLPYFEGLNLQQMFNLKEIGQIFPMLLDILQIKSPPNSFIENVYFGHKECCEFQDPKEYA